ncbi:MAG: C10 family peptidase [Bacteroidales bacterium]|nr:C10 family peptidase [Bacteroidales bacterium]
MKRLILAVALIVACGAAEAKPVGREAAQSVAKQFWQSIPGAHKRGGSLALRQMGIDNLYLFVHSSGRGYVVVSGDDCALPVVAYSLDSRVGDTLPEVVRWWLEGISRQIALAAASGAPADGMYYEAQYGTGGDMSLTSGEPSAVAPMIATRWGQSWDGYNDSCPLVSGERSLTGCVATATAQVMKYWNHPYRGTNSTTTFSDVNLATAYDWANMPAELTSASSDAQKAAVAQLMFHVGRAVSMNYGLSASSAYTALNGENRACAEQALWRYFGYSRNIISLSRGHFTEAEWTAILKGELAAGRPVLYAGDGYSGGHAFVCDGYDAQDRFHFNWGWNGVYDGYFLTNALHPGSGGTGSNSDNNYSMNMEIIIGIKPEWTVGLPFSEDFSDWRHYWTGSLAAGDTLRGPKLALPTDEATLTWQATATGTYAILLGGTPVYTGSEATGSVSLSAYASTNPQIAITTIGGSLTMQSLAVSTGSQTVRYNIAGITEDATKGRLSGSDTRVFDGYYVLSPRPQAGYRFSHWDDGSSWNRRYVFAGGDRTYTAYFEPILQGDTLQKDNGNYTGYTSRTSMTSMTIDKNIIRNNSQLTAVMYYPDDSGAYKIYMLNPSDPSDTLFCRTVYPAYPGMWNTCYLKDVLRLDSTKVYTVWVQTMNKASWLYHKVPNFCGQYSSQSGIRCIFNGLFNPRQLTVVGGSGSGLFLRDTTVVITADQGGSNRFLGWNDGNTDNPRSVRVVSDTTFIASYSTPSKIYVRFESNDTTLGSVTTASGWHDFEVTRLVNGVDVVVNTPKARFLGWSSTYPDSSEVWATHDQDYTHVYIYLDSAYVYNHDTLTFTAHFAPVEQGDTLIYDTGGDDNGGTMAAFSSTCCIGTSHKVWGVRYDPALLTRRNQLTAVQLFTNKRYQYDTVRVYSGGTSAPQTLLREQVFGRSPMEYFFGWQTYTFSSPITIDPSQSVWITISAKDEILTTAYEQNDVVYEDFYTGNPDGSWVYQPGTGWRSFTVVFEYGVNNNCHRRLSTASDAAPYFSGTWPLRAIMPEVLPQYTLTATSANTAQGTVSGSGRYRQGTAATLTATPAAGYRFHQWQDGNQQNPRSVIVVQDTQFIASFQALPTFTLTVVSSNTTMGTVSGGGSYYEGATATLKAIPTFGHRFVQWQDGNTQSSRNVTVTANATYTATFEAVPTFTLTVAPNDPTMGTVTGSGTYMQGDSVRITATANAGFRFVQWQDGNRQTSRIVCVTANATYTATFEAIPTYTITVLSSDPAMGTVSGGGNYQENSTAILTATPNAGFRFVKWNDGNTQPSRSVTITANATYTATFEAIPTYTITAVANDTTMGTVSGGGNYPMDTIILLTATPKTGFRFVQWQDGNTQASRYVTVRGAATYTATFAPTQGIAYVDEGEDVLHLLPNPATSLLTLELPWQGESTEVDLIAMDGRIAATLTVSGDRPTIDVSLLPRGIYLVRATAGNRQALGKVELR